MKNISIKWILFIAALVIVSQCFGQVRDISLKKMIIPTDSSLQLIDTLIKININQDKLTVTNSGSIVIYHTQQKVSTSEYFVYNAYKYKDFICLLVIEPMNAKILQVGISEDSGINFSYFEP